MTVWWTMVTRVKGRTVTRRVCHLALVEIGQGLPEGYDVLSFLWCQGKDVFFLGPQGSVPTPGRLQSRCCCSAQQKTDLM